MNSQHDMLDDVALYALGTLPPAEAQRVRAHIAQCEECRAEYEALLPAVTAIGVSAESCSDPEHGAAVASPLLKARIMREVRSTGIEPVRPAPRGARPWPAYFAAAACFAIAVASLLFNLSLIRQLHATQDRLALQRTVLGDFADASARRYPVQHGEVVAVHDRLYLAMHPLPALPAGKVYQAWTLAKGSKTMAPSRTFVPDSSGIAIVPVDVAASETAAVAVSIEPQGGSKAPTTKPVALAKLD